MAVSPTVSGEYQPTGRQAIAWPTAPGNAATIALFSTHAGTINGVTVTTPSTYHGDIVDMLHITFLKNNQASATNGLRFFAYDGTTWHESDLKDDGGNATIGSGIAGGGLQVPALSSGQEHRESFRTTQYSKGFCVTYTAGATGPTDVTGWAGVIVAILNKPSVQQ